MKLLSLLLLSAGLAWWSPVLGAGVLLLGLVLASVRPGLRIYGPAHLRGHSAGSLALSFDDGPDPASTPALLGALREAGAKATFFLLVDRAEAHPELTAAIAAEHEIGLHGLRHDAHLTWRSPEEGAAELVEAARRLQELSGQPIRWYRPPFGVTSPRLAKAVRLSGLEMVWCSLRTLDGVLGDDERLVRTCERASPGDIVLLHEGPRAAARVMDRILERLRQRELRSVTVSTLLERG